MLRFNDRVCFSSAFDEISTAASTKQHMLVPLCLCTLNVYMCKSGHVFLSLHEYEHVDFRGITTAQRLPLPTALRGDRGAKGDVTAMSAPCMCLFAPENETPVSLQPPGHV